MKKSLLAAVAALAIAGCSQNDLVDEIDNVNQIGKTEMKVTSVISKNSRAAETKDVKSGFTLYAYQTDGLITDHSEAFSKTIIDNKVVTFDNNEWKIGDGSITYYWPEGKKVQFFAYGKDDNATYNVGAPYPTISYTIANQNDFVVCKLTDQETEDAAIELPFSHALTQVNFSAKAAESSDGLTYKVTGVKISGLYKSGTYKFEDGTWTASTTPADLTDYAYTLDNTKTTVTGTDVNPLGATDAALMLIPQAVSSAKIIINYTISLGGEVIKTVIDHEIALSSITTAWQANKKVRFTIALANEAKKLTVTARVNGWEDQEVDNTVPAPAL